MTKVMRVLAAVVMLTVALGVGAAWAIVKVTVTRDEIKPRTLEIRAGEAVEFVNVSGRTSHVWFGGNDAIRFYVGKAGSTIKFERPGRYDYTVHVQADKAQSHTGTIVVK